MCSFGPETDVNIRSLIWRLFRDAADEDYLVARWAVQVGLEYQFAWSAQQALEKYLKCALLMNGESVLKFGHNLHGMHEKAREIAGDILPYIYIPPSEFPMNGPGWTLPYDKFVNFIENSGNPSSRYRYHSITHFSYYLHIFDEFCFQLRRICFPLNLQYNKTGETYRNYLSRDPKHQTNSKRSFHKRGPSPGYESILDAEKWRNFSYHREFAISEGNINRGAGSNNSEIFLSTKRGIEGLRAISWLLDRAYFSPRDKAKLKQIVSEHPETPDVAQSR